MTVQVGDELLGGQVIVVAVSNMGVVTLKFPLINDGIGNPLTVTWNPALTVLELEEFAQAVIDLLGG